jgi:DNA replication protein DnaC
MKNKQSKVQSEELLKEAQRLGLWGIVKDWNTFKNEKWIVSLIEAEQKERHQRSLARRFKQAKLGRFRTITDFNWKWPKEINRRAIENLLKLDFISEPENIIIIGASGVGKTMIAKNIVEQAVLNGYTALFVTAMEMLNNLATKDSGSALVRRLHYYAKPDVLVIDEIGYLASTADYANLLFEVVTLRYEKNPIILTSNKPITQWGEVFPGSACVVALVDRLIHKAQIFTIIADSYRLKEATERASSNKQTPNVKNHREGNQK